MNRRTKILRNAAIGLTVVLLLASAVAIIVVRTDWFRNYTREKIISATEEATGGRVEIGSFSLQWRNLRAVVTNFVIHGNEPASEPPFVRVARVELDLRLFTSLHNLVNLAYLDIERPEAHVIVSPDGSTNIPAPKQKSSSNTTGLETVVDLAVQHFELSNGLFTLNSHQQPLNVRADNLRAQLWYNLPKGGYSGQFSLQPVYVVAGRQTPVNFTITLPVTLERDRVALHNASIATPSSRIMIEGSIENLRQPKTAAQINGRVALSDLKKLADLPLDFNAPNAPRELAIEASAAVASDAIDIRKLRLELGGSNFEASGKLRDSKGAGALHFDTQLALGELARLAKVAGSPDGRVALNGEAKLEAGGAYAVSGDIAARNVSFEQSGQRIRGVGLISALRVDPHHLDLNGFQLTAPGSEVTGNLSLEDFARYKLAGALRRLDLRAVAETFGQRNLPYDGVVSGPIQAAGDLKAPGTKSLTAGATLSIAPSRRGIPVSGRLNLHYDGAADNLTADNSYIALPHTRLTLSGSIGKRLELELTTRDPNELLAAASPRPAPVALNGGQATLTAVVTGALSTPRITSHLAVNRLSVEGRQFDALSADLAASPSGIAISNGNVTRSTMQARFAASVALKDWKTAPAQKVSADASVQNGDLADALALAGEPSAGYSGALSASAQVSGTLGNPVGQASLTVSNGTIQGEPFDRMQAQVNLSDRLVTLPDAYIVAGPARIDLSAELQHPRETFASGALHARLKSTPVELAQFRNALKQWPGTSGRVEVAAELSGSLSETKANGAAKTEFLAASVTADVSARALRFDGQAYGDFTAAARTNAQTVNYTVTSDFAGSNIHATGNTRLARGYPTEADLSVGKLPVEKALAIAKRNDVPAKGLLSVSAHLSGTLENPQGNATVELANAVIYDEPVDSARLRIVCLPQSVDVQQAQIVAGRARITLAARFDHSINDFRSGDIQFHIDSNGIDLARIRNLQKARPGLGGAVKIEGQGKARLEPGGAPVSLQDLNLNLSATGIAVERQAFGDLTLTANTAAGRLNVALDSNLAGASIHGSGAAQLAGDYPLNASLKFANVTWSRLHELAGANGVESPTFEAAADGQVSVSGPARNTDRMHGSAEITRLVVNTIPAPGDKTKPVVFQNQGPLAIALDNGVARVTSMRITGPQVDFQTSGSLSTVTRALDLTVSANADLAVLRDFSRDITSSGSIGLSARVRGDLDKPLVNGKLELKNASANYASVPNGISSANGVVTFNGNSVSFRDITAKTGGGSLTLSGFASYAGDLRFGLRAKASNVRVRPQQGVSLVADAAVDLAGGMRQSLLSGTVTVNQLTYAPQSDIGSILTRAAPAVQEPETPSPLLDNMRLDIRVRTSPSMTIQSAMAENLQSDADLQIRGTASEPGVLGRVTLSAGQLVFFGSSYRVNSGSISFYDPARIEPVLNVSLETQSQGVDVSLTVTGPIDNMKLSYTSDPPLQFQEIVALLASGKTPTSDPNILANQPSQPPQSFEQMGESALVSKALADPVASRLQRVFGVSQLKVDPTFVSGSQLPQARLTLQQRVSSNVTFTYVTDLNAANTQIVRAEWAFNTQWSAVAMRDQNGVFSINFFYKKQFR